MQKCFHHLADTIFIKLLIFVSFLVFSWCLILLEGALHAALSARGTDK